MENAFTIWTSREEQVLLFRLAQGIGLEEIAVELRRSVGAIRMRRRYLALQFFRRGRSLRDIRALLCMTYVEMEDVIRQALSPNCR